jgi:hypothetical protein
MEYVAPPEGLTAKLPGSDIVPALLWVAFENQKRHPVNVIARNFRRTDRLRRTPTCLSVIFSSPQQVFIVMLTHAPWTPSQQMNCDSAEELFFG